MIAKINELKNSTSIASVKTLCESAIGTMGSAIYNNVTPEAKLEIERVSITHLFEQLEKFADNKQVFEWLTNQKRMYILQNLGVRHAINTLLEKEGKYNVTLAMILEDFRDKVQETPEVLLYEEFISAVSGFNHLPAVNTELEAVASRVNKYRNDVEISKIIETMKDTRSNYLIPLIEDVVDGYLSNKTEQTKHILKETLVKFSYDPFVRDILNIVTLDATQLQLEYNNAECSIEDKLFSPLFYLGENEVLFNIKGTYYVKKQNNISKIKKENVSKLDENFKTLCNIINYPSIEVTKKDIRIFIGNDSAVLTETQTFINGSLFTTKQINEAAETAKWGGNSEFFTITNTLRENFNEIAELDFVKRVQLVENENYAADIFKLRDNIFITTFDPINNKATFYRNINPIQAEKVMMEHMRFDVSKTFADILPNKEKILAEINETKQEYSDYIKLLEEKMNQFSNESGDTAAAVISALQEELDEVTNDYKDYLNEVESFLNVNENLNITVQDDQSGKSYTVVVPTGAMAAKGSGAGEEAEGDEFGTEVGMSSMKAPDGIAGGASSEVTFDDDQTELLSDEPSSPEDKVDMNADDIEAYADKVDAEKDLEGTEDKEELGADGAEDTAELKLDTKEPAEGAKDAKETEEEIEEPQEEAVGAPNKNLERTNFNKDKNPGDLNSKKTKKVFLKRHKK